MADTSNRDFTVAEASGTHHVENTVLVDLDDPHRAALEDNPEKPEKLSWSTILSVFFLGLSFVAPLSCGFVLAVGILVPIGTALGDTTHIGWIPGGWSVASSVSFSIAGSLSDIFGRRNVILVGQGFTIIGAIVGATAMTTLHVAAASTVLGFGCGIIFVGYAGIPELLPNKWRGIGLGWTEFCITMPWAIVAVLLGNALADHASWRWCYYISIIYSVICLVGTAIFYFPPHRPQLDYDKSRWQEVKEIDYIGLFLYATGLTIFLVGLNWAGGPGHGWKSVSVIAPIVLGFLAFVACFVYDFTLAKRPFFPFELFRQVREFTILLVLVFVSGMIFYSMAGLLPQGSLYMFTNNPTEIGLLALPNGFSQLVGGWVIPSLAHRIKHLKWQLTTLLCFQTLFVALYAAVIPTNKAAWSAFQFFGQGCFAAITLISYIVAGLHIPQRQLGIATGLIGTFRSAGGSVGITVFNTILSSTVNSRLGPQISKAALAMGFPVKNLALLIPATIENAVGVPNAFAAVPGVSPAIELAVAQAFKDVYAYAFRRVFLITIPFGVVAIIATLFIRDPSMYLTNHVAVHMEKEGITGAARRVEASTVAHTHGHEMGTSTALEGGSKQEAIGSTSVHSTV